MSLPARIYHLAESSNWPSIQRDGLLCAHELIRRAVPGGADRARLAQAQRPAHAVLPHGVHIRDQKPMPPKALESCLHEMTPEQWYATINARVFFWLDPDRLNRQRKAAEPRPQVAIAVDTAALLAAHKSRIALTPINTGNARRKPARRGAATFVAYREWLESGWASEAKALGTTPRSRWYRPVELTVLDAVPDIMRFVVDVAELPPGRSFAPRAR